MEVTFAEVLLGLLLPPVVSLLKRAHWSKPVKFLLSLVVSVVAGGLIGFVEGGLSLEGVTSGDPDRLLGSLAVIFLFSQVAYRGLYKGTSLDKAMKEWGSPPVVVERS